MRSIGHLPDQQAQVFSDFLVARGIQNEIEHDPDGRWSIWVRDEDHVDEALVALMRYNTDPQAPEFRNATMEAMRAREAEVRSLEEYRRRVRTRRSMFAKFGSHGVGVLTYILIVACVLVAFYTKAGDNKEVLRRLFITDLMSDGFLPEVRSGEFWRLITPIFIHFGWVHLIFNMLWLFDLGCMIEARQGSLTLAALVAVSGVLSNLGQYALAHTITFGGMSGVVYALAGYVWIRGKYDRASGVGLNQQSVTILLVWLVICYSGVVGPVANTAHLVGLIVGMLWGRISAYFALRKPE